MVIGFFSVLKLMT